MPTSSTPTRRDFLKGAFAVAATGALGGVSFPLPASATASILPSKEHPMTFTLPELPYAPTALEPYISANTLGFHHGKHHQAYITNLNNLVKDTPLATQPLEEIIRATAKDDGKAGIFNNAAQIWNHTFFWHSMAPNGGGEPKGEIGKKIAQDFGSFETLKNEFKNAAVTQFGSGWAWLVLDGGKLKVMKTANADLPLAHGQKALLTVDVWEHAYYLDYQNRRPDFVEAFLTNLANWDFAEKNLSNS